MHSMNFNQKGVSYLKKCIYFLQVKKYEMVIFALFPNDGAKSYTFYETPVY